MANKHRGEVVLEADGKAYTMRLSANALCELEGVLQRSAPEVFSGLESVDFRSVRAIVWAALTESVPGITLVGAGTIIDDVGIKVAVLKIAQLVAVTFPKDAGEASPENPL